MRKYIFILIAPLTLLGCITSVKENSLLGKYHFNNYTQDLLLLDKNHNYTHRYVNSRGKIFEVHGEWEYNGKEVLFHDFNFFNDLGASGGSGLWISRVSQAGEEIKLNYSDDDNTYFEKEK
jgi:hypothetical protein